MRFISQYPGYVVQIRPQRQRSLGDGSIEITQEPIYARFTSIADGAFVFENEELQARKQFNFHGNTQELDMATPTEFTARLALLDTEEFAERENLSPDDKAFVEARLTEISLTTPNDILLVTSTPISAPFPRYDSWPGSADDLVIRLNEDGFDLSEVLYYETTFGPRRAEMIEALEEFIEIEKQSVVSA